MINSVSECFLLKSSKITLIAVGDYKLTKDPEEVENLSRREVTILIFCNNDYIHVGLLS